MPRRANVQPLPDVPLGGHETRLRLETITDRSYFQALCDEVLASYSRYEYEVKARGLSARGTVPGQPDSWGTDREGHLCAFEYGASAEWRSKMAEDQSQIAKLAGAGFQPQVFVFCTNQRVDPSLEREAMKTARATYGWELRIIDQGDLAIALNTELQHVRKRYLGMRVEQHSFASLLAACGEHLKGMLDRYAGKYEPDLYIGREAEHFVENWYRSASTSFAQRKSVPNLLAIVDRAGTGKSNFALHLSRKIAASAPVVLLTGALSLPDDHGLEREIAAAVGYAVEGQSFQADLEALYRLAEGNAVPLLVVLDAANENRHLDGVTGAVTQLLASGRGHPLLVLITCRDAIWAHVRDPMWESTAYKPEHQPRHEFWVSLGGAFEEREFRDALSRYLSHWEVSVDLGPQAARELRSPLLLRVFCEVNAGRKLGYLPRIAVGDLWEAYTRRKIDDIWRGTGGRLRTDAILSIVEEIARRMLTHDSPVLELKELEGIRHLDPYDDSPQSLLVRMKDAAVLLEDPPGLIRFAHEPFLEVTLARTIARQIELPEGREQALTIVNNLTGSIRWRPVAVHVAALVEDATPVIELLLERDIWLASAATLRSKMQVDPSVRERVVSALLERLKSRYELDRSRASDMLGRLGAVEATAPLFERLLHEASGSATRSLARLGCKEAAEPFILYLGRRKDWYTAEDQLLTDAIPPAFRARAVERAIALLEHPDWGQDAAHALGYLRAQEAVGPLLASLPARDWSDSVAFRALLRIGTDEAMTALELAMGEASRRAK